MPRQSQLRRARRQSFVQRLLELFWAVQPENPPRPDRQKSRLRFAEKLDERSLMAADLALPLDLPAGVEPLNEAPRAAIVKFASPDQQPAGQLLLGSRELMPGMWRVELPATLAADQVLAQWESVPTIEYVELDALIQPTRLSGDDYFDKQWAHHNTEQTGGKFDADIDSATAWEITRGTGKTVVAVIDTGIDWTHPDLKDNIWRNGGEIPNNGKDDDRNGYVDDIRGWDFVEYDKNPMDEHGHGTHVAGIIGADGNNGKGVAGVSWNVQLMPLRVLDKNGSGYTSDIIQAVYYAVNNGATISNNSYGGASYSQAMEDAIVYARNRNHIFVAAAGNDGANLNYEPDFPASYGQYLDNVVVVGATNDKDKLAGWSNYGKGIVDIAAPGASIISTVLQDQGPKERRGYAHMSGTSMATPFVAGAASLVRDLHPEWNYKQVINHLLGTADHPDGVKNVVTDGRRLNVGKAVKQAAATPKGMTSEAAQGVESQTPAIPVTPPRKLPNTALAAERMQVQIESIDNGENDVATPATAIPQQAKYEITINGEVNGKKFELDAVLLVRPTQNKISLNDINPRDIFIKARDPLAKPKLGSLWLASNNSFFKRFGFYDAAQKMDLGNMKMNANKGTLSFDVQTDLVYSGLNLFNDKSGILAPMYRVVDGGVDLQFKKNGDQVTGKINLVGSTSYVPGMKTPKIKYEATITGKRES